MEMRAQVDQLQGSVDSIPLRQKGHQQQQVNYVKELRLKDLAY
jgi:hypothetical protein